MNKNEACHIAINCCLQQLLGKEKCVDFFPEENWGNANIDELSEAAKNVSQKQKVAIFAYIKLYSKLIKDDSCIHDLFVALDISKPIAENVETVLSEERVHYVRLLQEKLKHEPYMIFTRQGGYVANLIDTIARLPIREEKIQLKNLQKKDFTHPTDEVMVAKLKALPGFETLVAKINEYAYERAAIIDCTANNYLVDKGNIPQLHSLLKNVCKTLGLNKTPKLYVSNSLGLNAQTIGTKNPLIVIGSMCISLMSPEELTFMLGHEVGHILCNHFQYSSMVRVLPFGAEMLGAVTLGIGNLAGTAVKVPLMEWYRAAELTADRVGLLACQSETAAMAALSRMAGYPVKYSNLLNPGNILKQAEKFDELDKDDYNKTVKTLSIMFNDHPWTVKRAKELHNWIQSGAFGTVISRSALGVNLVWGKDGLLERLSLGSDSEIEEAMDKVLNEVKDISDIESQFSTLDLDSDDWFR